MTVAIVVIIFLIIWSWIVYLLYCAPQYDKNEMPIAKYKRKRVKRKFHIDNLDEGELYEELYRRNDDKEDVQ